MNPFLIEIKQERPGFDHFIGAWVYQGGLNFVIDVGPANSVNRLIEALNAMNLERVDFVLLTHIHVDHAGGLADFLTHFPMAKAICHKKGIGHLVDPSKLWSGSRKLLGEIAEAYGPVKPVEPEKLIPHTEVNIEDLKIIETPGHAPHHISFVYRGNLFVGEAGGNYFPIQDQEYLRPATPPIFLLSECLKSIDRLLEQEDQTICYAHFGKAQSSHRYLIRFKDQLLRWQEIIGSVISECEPHLVERCVDLLLQKDPDLKAFELMAPDDRSRERFFMANSVKGYIGFLKDNR